LHGGCHFRGGIHVEAQYSQSVIMIAAVFSILPGPYLAWGFLFTIPLIFIGVNRIDTDAAHSSWGFRLFIIPGTPACWPLRLRRWRRGTPAPPEERHAHRQATKGVAP
jgi:hypothetical protein